VILTRQEERWPLPDPGQASGQYKYVDGPLVPTLGLDLFECSMRMGNKSERPNAGSMASMLDGLRHSPEVPGYWLI